MEIKDIEQLVEIVKSSKVSELTVTAEGSTVRLRKPLRSVPPKRAERQPAPERPQPEQHSPPGPAEPQTLRIVAPMVGIYHSMDAVGSIGAAVKTGQPVGAIESMKLMNDVVSDVDGIITEVLVDDGMPVEYGQPLFNLRPFETETEG